MKIIKIEDPRKFIETIDRCVGTVELVTKEGDRLNLKSKLSQYISLVDLLEEPKLGNFEIICSHPEDYSRIFQFLIQD